MRKSNMRIVIAGFGPFPGAPSNPSGRLAVALARRRRPALDEIEMTSHVFATSSAAIDRDLSKLLAHKPDVMLIFGLAARRWQICIETRARNAHSILFPDVAGYRPTHPAIESGETSALRGNAPFPHLLNALRRTALPARLSRDAGAYLCNYTYWRALQHSDNGKPLVQFVHIPVIDLKSRRGAFRRRAPMLHRLATAGENLLIALLAADRRSCSRIIEAAQLSGPARPRIHSNYAKPARRNAKALNVRSRQAAKIAR